MSEQRVCCGPRCVAVLPGETMCRRCQARRDADAEEMYWILPVGVDELGCGGPSKADIIAEMRRVIGEAEYRKLFFRVKRRARRVYLHGAPKPTSSKVPF